MTKFLFRKSRKCIQKSSKKIFAFIIDFGKIHREIKKCVDSKMVLRYTILV